MIVLKTVLLTILINTTCCMKVKFPPGFKFGVASAAYQVEGGWNASDKGESIWDHFTHTRPNVFDGNGDVACDSYHLWRRDIEMVSELGAHFYRFSLSWPRILPNGYPNYISKDGVNYYNNLINGLLAKGIEPVITIYHWDLPQVFQDLGGWTNPLVADWFADFATVVFSLFADRVKTWLTINEANVMCDLAYNFAFLAPGINDPHVAPYLCNKHVLTAHAKAWRIYNETFKPKYHGRVSLANQDLWFEPETENDIEVTELIRLNCAGRYSYPIYSETGGWPPLIEKHMAILSAKEGYPRSRLPSFTKQEIELIKGTYDFYGLNHYTSRVVRKAKPEEEVGQWFLNGAPEYKVVLVKHPQWLVGNMMDFPEYPPGIRRQIAWLKKQYGNFEILITENGVATIGAGITDPDRIRYYNDYLQQVLLSIYEDGANVTGYTVWTLMDNFEWIGDAYRSKFGLYEVDFDHPNRTRTPRDSARFYAKVIKNHYLDVPEDYQLRDWPGSKPKQSEEKNMDLETNK